MKKLSKTVMNKHKSREKAAEFNQQVADALNHHTQMLTHLSARVVCLEELMFEQNKDLTPQKLEQRIETIVDRGEGLVPGDVVREGDKVRLEIKTANQPDTDFTKMIVRQLGRGLCLPVDVEKSLLRAKPGERVIVPFPKGGDVEIKIHRISTPAEATEES